MTEKYVSLAVREYGAGRICIHTDRIDSYQTGHGDNKIQFWRKVFQWVSKKENYEKINVGIISNINDFSNKNINLLNPIYSEELTFEQLLIKNLNLYYKMFEYNKML